MRRAWRPVVAAALILVFGAACGAEPSTPPQAPQGDPELGRQASVDYGCTGCHVIPGTGGVQGTVAAPLDGFSRRHFIAGKLPNNADNLARWIAEPREVDPATAMPDLGVSERDAQDIAAYLLSLE